MKKFKFLPMFILLVGFVFILAGCKNAKNTQTQNQNGAKISGQPAADQVSDNQAVEEGQADLYTDWQTYKNESYNYEIKYPKNWYFLKDGCCPPPPANVTLNNYSSKKLEYAQNQMKPGVYGFDVTCLYEGNLDSIGEVKFMLQEGKSNEKLTVNGMEAIKFSEDQTPGDSSVKIFTYYITKGNEGCRIIFTNQCDVCDEILATFKKTQ
ncbi:MAG: hypothetical protein NT136_02240 [Candidatus Moranbacteria bacterium]|nr:hypothetical protein [Candidatus Moranbacteria bacterium]